MSSGSGIAPTAVTLATVEELRKNNSKYIFALFKINGNDVVPDVMFPEDPEETKRLRSSDQAFTENFEKEVWPKFLETIEKVEGPRFVVMDFAFQHADGRAVRVLSSLSWCPDKGVTAKQKMTFASTKTAFEAKINIGKKYPANDLSDLEFKTVLDFIKANK